MAEKYATRDDINRRLNRTICLWEGKPYYVSSEHGSRGDEVDLLSLTFPSRMDLIMRVDHTNNKFVDRSLPLGYMNRGQNCHWVSRVPMRMTVQPITQRHLRIDPNAGGEWFLSEDFSKCILGTHPKYGEAMALIRDRGYQGVAIHRHVALAIRPDVKHLSLYYKNRLIAMFNGFTERWDYLPSPEIVHFRKIVERLGCVG